MIPNVNHCITTALSLLLHRLFQKRQLYWNFQFGTIATIIQATLIEGWWGIFEIPPQNLVKIFLKTGKN